MNIHDEKLPGKAQDQIDKNMNRVQIGDGPYAYYPLFEYFRIVADIQVNKMKVLLLQPL